MESEKELVEKSVAVVLSIKKGYSQVPVYYQTTRYMSPDDMSVNKSWSI